MSEVNALQNLNDPHFTVKVDVIPLILEKKHIIIKINDIQKLNSIIFENIGNIAYHNRIEDEKLKDIYTQIDITEKKIRNLEAR